MSIDQREPGRGAPDGPEFRARRTGTPFKDGSSFAEGWRVRNDGTLITLTQESIIHGDPLELRRRVPDMADRFPVLGRIFTLTQPQYATTRPYTICTIPTVDTANAAIRATFAGLPTAGIELVQTPDLDETPVAEYVDHVMKRRLVAGAANELYLHDLFAHWVGTAALPEREFTVYQELVGDLDAVGAKFGEKTRKQYLNSLGRGFDTHSAFVFWRATDEPLPNTLPDDCLQVIAFECPEVLERSTALVKAAGDLRAEERTAHYDLVRKALQQDPWTPPNYVEPQPR